MTATLAVRSERWWQARMPGGVRVRLTMEEHGGRRAWRVSAVCGNDGNGEEGRRWR